MFLDEEETVHKEPVLDMIGTKTPILFKKKKIGQKMDFGEKENEVCGSLENKKGDTFVGCWKYGKFHGDGKLIMNSGDINYDGD